MIFDKVVLLTIFLYITLNLRKIENFIDGGYKFEAFTAKKDKKIPFTLQTTPGAIKGRVVYTIIKSSFVSLLLLFLIERHDKIGPAIEIKDKLTANTWDGQQITQGQTFNGDTVSDIALNETSITDIQKQGLPWYSLFYNIDVDNYLDPRFTIPITSLLSPGNPSWKAWMRDQLAPLLFLLWTVALWITLVIAWTEDLNSSLWKSLLRMETITNEVMNFIIIYAILKFAQKDVSKGTEEMAVKIYNNMLSGDQTEAGIKENNYMIRKRALITRDNELARGPRLRVGGQRAVPATLDDGPTPAAEANIDSAIKTENLPPSHVGTAEANNNGTTPIGAAKDRSTVATLRGRRGVPELALPAEAPGRGGVPASSMF